MNNPNEILYNGKVIGNVDDLTKLSRKTGVPVAQILAIRTGERQETVTGDIEKIAESEASERREMLGIRGKSTIYSFGNTHYNKDGVQCRRPPKAKVSQVRKIQLGKPEMEGLKSGLYKTTAEAIEAYKKRTFVSHSVSFTTKAGQKVQFATKYREGR